MLTRPKWVREIDDIIGIRTPVQAGREDVVFKLLTPEESELVGGGEGTGYCQTIGTPGYQQTGGGSFTQSGGSYSQTGGSYNMTCPQPSGPR
jgi:hypothetical protein